MVGNEIGTNCQDDRKSQSVISNLSCEGMHQISLLQYAVVVDSHMHIESGRCAPLQYLQNLTFLAKNMSRSSIESSGIIGGYAIEATGFIYHIAKLFVLLATGADHPLDDVTKSMKSHLRQLTEQSMKPTLDIAKDFMAARNEVKDKLIHSDTLYKGLQNLIMPCIVMTMDMEYAHLDGYYGLKLYNAIYKTVEDLKNLNPCAYWSPVPGHWQKEATEKDDTKYELVTSAQEERYIRTNTIGRPAHPIMTAEFEKTEKQTLIGSCYDTSINKTIQVAVDSVPVLTTPAETKKYEQWEKQLKYTELAVLKYPLKLLPLFHYDPRRWQPGESNAFPMEQVTGKGLYLGFKMYTAQGYRPIDNRLPIMRDFYRQCSIKKIPIMNHCTPDGAATFDKKQYRDFAHLNDTRQEKEEQQGNAESYFNEHFVSPYAWKKVLDRTVDERQLNDLHLCLAHFGGPTKLGMQWNRQIIEMIESGSYPNLYTDISSSFGCSNFREEFGEMIGNKKRLKDRILFGTDWYMSLSYSVPFEGNTFRQYCESTKECLDAIDQTLWPKFTQTNPYLFYRLNEQIERIASNIIKRRQNEEIYDELIQFQDNEVTEILREAAFIKAANRAHIVWEETPWQLMLLPK